jgi:hypothetical protein
MRSQKKSLYLGIGMMATFAVVLVLLFTPLVNGHNILEYLDNLYNSISKGSAYYVPRIREDVQDAGSRKIDLSLKYDSAARAAQVAPWLSVDGVSATAEGNEMAVTGDLQTILLNVLDTADIMYHNEGNRITAMYGYDERAVMYDWWKTLKALEYSLNKQERFADAKLVALVQAKAVETSYNYYGIKPENIGDKYGIVFISLLFYVIYTLWYGFGILYLFEGWGLRLGH